MQTYAGPIWVLIVSKAQALAAADACREGG